MSKVIVKLLSGEEKRGKILSFNINQPTFYVQVESETGVTEAQMVRMDSVKAIFFPKPIEEKESHIRTETIDQSIFAGTLAFRLTVEFKDG